MATEQLDTGAPWSRCMGEVDLATVLALEQSLLAVTEDRTGDVIVDDGLRLSRTPERLRALNAARARLSGPATADARAGERERAKDPQIARFDQLFEIYPSLPRGRRPQRQQQRLRPWHSWRQVREAGVFPRRQRIEWKGVRRRTWGRQGLAQTGSSAYTRRGSRFGHRRHALARAARERRIHHAGRQSAVTGAASIRRSSPRRSPARIAMTSGCARWTQPVSAIRRSCSSRSRSTTSAGRGRDPCGLSTSAPAAAMASSPSSAPLMWPTMPRRRSNWPSTSWRQLSLPNVPDQGTCDRGRCELLEVTAAGVNVNVTLLFAVDR